MARRKQNNRNENPFEESREPRTSRAQRSQRYPSKTKRRRWPYVLLFLILLLSLLPNIIGWAGLHQTAINYATSDFNGKILVEHASFGWFQPISLSNISAVDADGNDLLNVEQVTTSKPLYAFLRGSDYGNLDIKKPTVYVQLRPDGSNFEDALAEYLVPVSPIENTTTPGAASATKPTDLSPLPRLTVNVTDGRALISSSSDSQSWQIDEFQAVVNTSSAAAPLTIESQCHVTPLQMGADGQMQMLTPGRMTLQSQFDPGSMVLSVAAVDLVLATENMPLSLAAPLLQRFIGPAQSAGQLSGNIQSKINLNKQAMNVEIANLNMQGLTFAAPELIGSDQISIQQLSANGSLELSPQIISSSNFELISDFGKIDANGRFNVNQLNELATGGALLNEPFQMDGQIDLAGLVRMLPSTLKLHQDLTVDSGTIQFQAGTKNEEGTRRLVMNLDAANLKARRGTQNIVWQKPLRLVGTIVQSGNRLAIEDLLCESDFLAIAGSASPQTGAFRAQGDLSKLVARAGEFMDLTGFDLAGEIDGTFGWQTAENTTANLANSLPIQIGGNFVIDHPVIQLPDMPVWRQPQLSIKMSASGQSLTNPQTSEMILSLEQGGVQVQVGSESAVATLSQPLHNAFTDPITVNCDVTGGLNGWLGHIRNFVDLGEINAAGDLALTCSAALNQNQLQLSDVQYNVSQFDFVGYGVKIRDPQVSGTAQVGYDLITGNIAVPDLTVVGESLAARGHNLTLVFAQNMRVDGTIAFRADVNRVADWVELSPTEDSVFWFGSAVGDIQLSSNENGIAGRLTSTITDLVAAQRTNATQPSVATNSKTTQQVSNRTEWVELHREAQAQFDTELLLSNDFDTVQFQNLTMKSSALSLNAAGSVSDLAATLITNVQGTWNPNWKKVQSLLAAYTGNLFQLSGSGDQPFSVIGPVFATDTGPTASTAWIPSQLSANTSVHWDEGSILNVPIGASQIDVDVDNSIGKIVTAGIPFSGGVVKFAPSVDMRGENPILVMEQTRIIDNVALTPETARQWLKYVAPLAADATSAQGNFTLDVEGVSMPIYDPLSVQAKGMVRLNNVVIGAGPLADQLIGTITQIRSVLKPETGEKDLRTWLQMSEQTIPIQVKDQKVYHENVTFKHNDTVVVTSGAVGFDQSLNMVAEIPIADDWIAGKSFLAGLKGQTISIPIHGTVTKPQLDTRSIQNLSSQLVKQAAGNALNQAIAEKVAPKLGEYQNQINDKLGAEMNKIQEKIGGQLGQQLGERLGSQLPNVGGFFPQNTNGTPAANSETTPPETATAPTTGTGATPDLKQQLEGELIKGIGNLFGGKK